MTEVSDTVINDDLILDNWTNLSFKRVLGSRKIPGRHYQLPNWVGEHARRLMAYRVLQAYIDNAARIFLQTTDQDDIDNHREYGDAALIRDRILAALLGDDQQLVTDGADSYDPDHPDTDPTGVETAADAKAAYDLQKWFEEWAWTKERMGLKIIENERNSVGLGDGVYTLGWSPEKGRVRCRVFDPGFYFPVLTDNNEDDFPEKVHIAWEIEEEGRDSVPSGTRTVRRITWELRDLPGSETRKLAWNDKPTRKTCYMTDARWTFEIGAPMKVDDFSAATAVYETFTDANGVEQEWKDLDLGFDFVPVIHLPNTVSLLQHYGQSVIAKILQILDDLSNVDTDLQASASTTAKPPLAIAGAAMTSAPSYRPGEVWATGDGTATMIDTSKSLDALLQLLEVMLKRLSVNARTPDSVLGRVALSGDVAGITLALSFGPLEALVNEMRLVRDEKYPLLFKFVHRIAIAAKQADVPEKYVPTKMEFGRFLPNDQSAAVLTVQNLLTAKAISRETAVAILIGAGLPIDNALEEIMRIEKMDFDGADKLQAATGDDQAVRDYLHLEGPAPVVSPPAARPAPGVPPTGDNTNPIAPVVNPPLPPPSPQTPPVG